MTRRERSEPTEDAGHEAGTPVLAAGLGNVLFDVWLVSRAATALIDAAVKPAGLDADEFAIYSVLASAPGLTPTELARWMAAPPTTVSSYIKRFERRGHVRRAAHPEDRRSYRVHLTAAGAAAHQAAGERFLPRLQEVTRLLGRGGPDTHRRLRVLHEALATLNESGERQI
ncbi:MarR family winged helix-turn-helix transcriptional regulator [Intrasporangium sp. YIM S08009]|uniref:MarR family winged helix-turn-helix transcriptional regulator n=1 Tax=Intrasporangium zincisolvens TaxID=3080018 RepID=UPI002B060831|nr:MarR family transcriptional regulator [Intrasporangium sp. YIM S08009]